MIRLADVVLRVDHIGTEERFPVAHEDVAQEGDVVGLRQRYLVLIPIDRDVVLELDEGEQFEVVESTYKYLRSLHHPDKNGEPEKFIQVQKAYNDYLKLLNKEEIKK